MVSKASSSIVALALVAALGFASNAHAVCDTGNPANPENDCDNDGFSIQQGDCNDDLTLCGASCDPAAGPYTFGCICGQRKGFLINPGHAEVCDGQDNNCNTLIDEGLVIDQDADGVRKCGTCGAAAAGSCDCDDTRNAVKPGATEICDAIDNNCNGAVDEGGGPGGKMQQACYPGPGGTQGVGVCHAGLETCNASTPGVASWFGCDAVVPSNPPAQAETLCNNLDDDCDGVVDDGLLTDADGDGSRACLSCGAAAAPNCDCNDGNSGIKPGAPEACNGLDDNCNGSTDEGIAARKCYTGPAGTFTGTCPGPTCSPRGPSCVAGTQTCSAGAFGACSGDSFPPGVNPAAPEVACNGIDDDCDGVIDDGLIVDADGDGYRACGSCGAPAAPNCDCNDGNAAIHPGAAEICDNVDNNCNGSTDEGIAARKCFDGAAGTFGGACPGPTCAPKGTCVAGTQTCVVGTGTWSACGGETLPAAEICNDCLDTDCDGRLFNGFADADNDGVPACSPAECNDNNNKQHGAFCAVGAFGEICDSLDNNCNGSVDEGLGSVDGDGDGSLKCGTCGAAAAPNCDCNDANAAIHPGATELCDCIDQNCNGSITDGYDSDADGDGVPVCAGASIECNDSPPNGNRQHGAWCGIPAKVEVCDALDNNCEGHIDERDAAGNPLRQSCYDGPPGTAGVGLCVTGLQNCTAVTPPTAAWGACVGEVVPTPEICDGKDNDCNGTKDNGFDNDGDGFLACGACASASPCDCNDNDASIHPGAVEICDSIDQNCDGQVNDVPARICFVGMFATPVTYTGVCPGPTCAPKGACVAGRQVCGIDGSWGSCDGEVLPLNDPTLGETLCNNKDDDCDGTVDDGNFDQDGDSYRTCNGDCNDNNPAIHPGAPEICDNLDNDCNGTVDGVQTSCYDGPAGTLGVGRCAAGHSTCTAGQPSGTCVGEIVPSNTPSAPETICNGIDDDCDGQTDDGFDADGDGAFSCALCPTYGPAVCDCDDNDKFKFPGNREICDCQDNNCKNGVDEGGVCTGAPCFDFDDDGYTNCQGDCDDHNTLVNPGRSEIVGNGIDDDCNGAVDEDVDVDRDGYTTGQGDCNDHLATVHPGAAEVCDGFDNNCNGVVDEGFDVDGDLVSTCAGDCNDNNPNVNPVKVFVLPSGAHISENCTNNIDDDCDGNIDQPKDPLTDLPLDRDGDGVTLCQGDCNDFNPSVHGAFGAIAAAPEICDGLDNNCNGIIDEGFDLDGDFVSTCFGDCDDTNPNVNKNHWEVPNNGIDDNCNGQIDEGQNDQDGDGFTPACGDCNDADPTINPHATEICDRKDNNCDSFIDSAPGNFNLCTTCFDADGDGQTNCDGDCNDSDPQIFRGAEEVCDGKDNDCDGSIDLDAFGLKVCKNDGGFDAGAGDAGLNNGNDAGVGNGDGGTTVPLPPDVLVGCGCSSSSGGGTGTWMLLGGFVAIAIGRMRRVRRAAVVLGLGAALTLTTTGCESLLRYNLDFLDAGTGTDGGVDDGGVLLSPEWKCGTQTPALVRVEKLPGSQLPFAVPERFTSTVVGSTTARVFEDTSAEVAAFALRRPLPSDISPLDLNGSETIGVRELVALGTLTGTPLVFNSGERFSRIFSGQTFSSSYRIQLAGLSEVYRVRNRLISFFTGEGLGQIGTMPDPSGGTVTDTYVLNVMYEIIGSDLIVAGAVTPDSKLAQNQSVMLDFSNGSAVGPVGSVLVSACEHRIFPQLQSDFIFVVDNSASMGEEQAALAAAASSLFDGFANSALDFRLGVVTTDSEVLRGNGFTRDQAQFQNDAKVGTGGSPVEEGLEYGKRAVQLAHTVTNPDRRIRDDAGVVLVFMSDEDSSNLLTPDQYAQFYNSQNVSCYAIVGPKPVGCVNPGRGSANAGISYIDVAGATGGTSGSICNPNLSETIQEVLLGALGAASRSPLVRQPVSSTLAVRTTSDIVRSRLTGFDYDPAANTVLFFGSVPPTGAPFQVAYQFFVTLQ